MSFAASVAHRPAPAGVRCVWSVWNQGAVHGPAAASKTRVRLKVDHVVASRVGPIQAAIVCMLALIAVVALRNRSITHTALAPAA